MLGWFTFLLRHFAKPFLPFMFPGEKVRGFNFEGMPYRMAKGKARFLDKGGAVYRSELGRLAFELITASKGALIRRLEGIYDEILIDEVPTPNGREFQFRLRARSFLHNQVRSFVILIHLRRCLNESCVADSAKLPSTTS